MNIQFFDDPGQAPRSREEVRFNQLGLYVHEGSRRLTVGFDITPFLERPSIHLVVSNSRGEEAATLSVIESLDANFSLTVHLRDARPTEEYRVLAVLYYLLPERERLVVDRLERTVNVGRPGEQ